MRLSIHTENPQSRAVAKAIEILSHGGVIVYPTDTVYGLGCDLMNKEAVERVHFLKRQDISKPFSFLCSDLKNISEYAKVSNQAFRLIKHLIPGPYTFLLPAARMKSIPKIVVSKRKTVGIRVPKSNVCHAIISALGHPIISTSVTNEDGKILTNPDDIHKLLGSQIDLILDLGRLPAIPSTIIDLTSGQPVIVREGAGNITLVKQFS